MRFLLRAAILALLIFGSRAQAQQTRIVGGHDALPGAYPFIAAIAHAAGGNLFDRQFCGGALINSRWVVTAAHCVFQNGALRAPSSIVVHVGAYNLLSSPGEQLSVSQIIAHPNYNPQSDNYDIALLQLAAPSAQVPIWLYGSLVGDGVSTRIIGWGSMVAVAFPDSPTQPAPDYPTTLREATVPAVSNSTCNVPYQGTITANMLCAGYAQGGTDTCQGDSGGPLVVYDNGNWALAGVVSFGNGCAWPNYYGVYSRISALSSFITTHVPSPQPTQPLESAGGVWGLWNSNLNMKNIVELVNNTGSDKTAQVYVAYSTGEVFSRIDIPLGPYEQHDLVLNDLVGFEPNAYGTVRVLGGVSGRIFSYRPRGATFDNFDFAFGIPVDVPQTGTTYVAFNTYQPSRAAADIGQTVANWLSLVNPTGSPASFTVHRYDEEGRFLSSSPYELGGWSREDIQGGHENPGPNRVGLLKIVPGNASKGYLAQLVRYGYRADGNFSFAFPLVPKSGEPASTYAPLSTMLNAENWLEVVNVSASPTNVTIRAYSNGGSLLNTTAVPLDPGEQYHYPATAHLGPLNLGHAEITSSGGAIVSQSMHYARTPVTEAVEAAYAIPGRRAVSGASTGSYNLFLNMYDFLKVINASNQPVTYDLTISGSSGSGSSRTLTVPAHSSVDLGLHEAQYGTTANSYGTALIQPHGDVALGGSVIRFRYNSLGLPEFIAPTDVR